MWLVIERPEGMDQGEVMRRELRDDETLDPAFHAEQWASENNYTLSPDTGHIPNCCGDIRVELRPDPDKSWHIWDGKSFYFATEED